MSKLTIVLIPLLILALVLGAVACGGLSEAEKHYNAGVELQEQGRLEEAIGEYDEAIRLDPQLALAYLNRGAVYNEENEFSKAIADCDKAIELDPNLFEAYYNRGLAYAELGEKAEAIADFEKVIAVTDDPELIEMARQQIEELRD